MLSATKVRIYPDLQQQKALSIQFGCVRWAWNQALHLKQQTWREKQETLSCFSLIKRLPLWKKDHPWLKDADSQILQQAIRNLDRAFSAFFDKRARFPRWKTKRSKQSIQYPQRVKIEGKQIYLPKIGRIQAQLHREIKGKIKTVTVLKSATGKYYASILTEDDQALPNPIQHLDESKVLGIDLGIKDFLVSSQRKRVMNPKFLQKACKNLRRKQKMLSRRCKGSRNRVRARKLLARAQERLFFARNDFQHQISKILADENQAVGAEDLNIQGILKNKKLSRAVGDISWGSFLNKLKYKLNRQGKVFVKIDRFFPSTQTCCYCKKVREEKLGLGTRVWTCESCGRELDRDFCAALNVKDETIIQLKADGHTVSACGGLHKTGNLPAVA
jgi:putative transposase